ncbi:MAG: RluA family pseudouridine synthase [Thermoanaerobaculia bacterium]
MATSERPPETIAFRVGARERLDLALAAGAPSVSRRQARRFIEGRQVFVNARPVAVASRFVVPGDRLAVVPLTAEITILVRTTEWIAIDKSAGMPTQPGRDAGALSAIEIAAATLDRSGDGSELFVVHRLDTGTSGVLLFARTSSAAARLSRLFSGRKIEKRYEALAHGAVDAAFTVDAAIGRTGPASFGVVQSGDRAVSHVEPIESTQLVSRLAIAMETGRTHQIRVHLAHSGHPIVGDRKYGAHSALDQHAGRLMLHAAVLRHSDLGEIRSPLPPDMRMFWNTVRAQADRA